MKTTISSLLIIGGIILMAGSGGDCDGQCGPGNSIADMLKIAGLGLTLFLTGSIIAIRNQ
tara:strand:+ start:1364 stop:1543 length:180 start_codon:yes stop_codon:yes gene_type:complete